MKKHSILLMAVFVSMSAFSQKTYKAMGWKLSKDVPQNELRINLGSTIFALYPEITYDRIISPDFSLGASMGVALDPDNSFFKYSIMPHARWFFGGNAENLRKYGAGFFIELNGGMFSRDIEEYNSSDHSYSYDKGTGAGLGLAIGWKYLSVNNWIGEVYFGGGRDFVNDAGYPRLGITVGKRF